MEATCVSDAMGGVVVVVAAWALWCAPVDCNTHLPMQ
jgi:hypothetical protein